MILEIKHLSKKYKKNMVFNEINFKFEQGVTVLLGANGTGKSTLMNILATSLPMDSGQIYFDNINTDEDVKKYRSKIGFVPQSPPSYPYFKVWEFLEYIALLKEIPKHEIPFEIDKVLDIVRLKEVKDKKIKQLSGGMKQRLAISSAFLGNPNIIILDEPTVGLDPKERLILKEYLKSISKEKIIILSTHIISDTENLADYIFMLNNGKVMLEGTIEEVISKVHDQNISSLDDIFLNMYDWGVWWR